MVINSLQKQREQVTEFVALCICITKFQRKLKNQINLRS